MNNNRNESKIQEFKANMSSCNRRDGNILRHIARKTNDMWALQALSEEFDYDAKVYNAGRHEWKPVRVVPTEACAEVVGHFLTKFTPHGSSTPGVGGPRPRGAVEWERPLRGEADDGNRYSGAASTTSSHSADDLSRYLPTSDQLHDAYDKFFGCGGDGSHGPEGTDVTRCPHCWHGGLPPDLLCRNYWNGADPSAGAGQRVIMGADINRAPDTATLDDVLLGEHGGFDMQFSRDPDDSGMHPIGRAILFFDHQLNPKPPVHDGAWTTWVSVLEYVTAGPGQERKDDSATGMPMFNLHKTATFFPVSTMTRVMQMWHACGVACRLTGGSGAQDNPQWTCAYNNRCFIMNEHYHRYGGRAHDDE